MSLLQECPEIITLDITALKFNITVDYNILDASGLLLSNYVHNLQVFKVTGNSKKGLEMFEKNSIVPQKWLKVRDMI
jgi:hypothetical protein